MDNTLTMKDKQALLPFKLFYHNSWIESRDEVIRYEGNSRWQVESDLFINRLRLSQLMNFGKGPSVDKQGRFIGEHRSLIPLLELSKRDRDPSLQVTDNSGTVRRIHPSEESATFEWMVLVGCIMHARDELGLRGDPRGVLNGRSLKFLSSELTDLIMIEFKRFAPPSVTREEYPQHFREKIASEVPDNEEKRSALLAEWDFFCEKVPGFLPLFVLFAYRWLPLIDCDVNDGTIERLHIDFCEYRTQSALKKEEKFLDRLKGANDFQFPLTRIGTAESESFKVEAPEWTIFRPLELAEGRKGKPARLFELKDESAIYETSENGGKVPRAIVDADGVMTERDAYIKTVMIWDSPEGGPYRRFRIPQSSEHYDDAVDWGKRLLESSHEYMLHAKMRAKPGKRGWAYFAFFLMSVVSLAYCLLVLLQGGHAHCHGSGPSLSDFSAVSSFLTALCTAVPLVALVFSNLQEETTYYRYVLLRDQTRLVRAGIVLDALVFVCMLFSAFHARAASHMIWPVVAVALFLMVVGFVLMCAWLIWNGDRSGINKRWVKDGYAGILSKLTVEQVAPVPPRR